WMEATSGGAETHPFRPLLKGRSQPEEPMAIPVRARHRLGDLREAAIGLAVPGETFVQDHHSFELAVPFAGKQRPGSKLGPFTGRRDPSGERSIARRSKRLALRLPDDAQRLLVEAAKRGGLDAIRQDPQEQPPRQMGGRGPAQVVAPLQAKAVQIEIDEAADHVVERRNAIRSRHRRKQGLADAVRLSALRHYAARRACGFAERDDFFRTAAEFARPSSSAAAAALASSLRSVWMR